METTSNQATGKQKRAELMTYHVEIWGQWGGKKTYGWGDVEDFDNLYDAQEYLKSWCEEYPGTRGRVVRGDRYDNELQKVEANG